MTDTPDGAPVVHLVGRAHAGDPVTTAAAFLCRRLTDGGRPGHLVSTAPTQVAGFEHQGSSLPEGDVVVHTVDGGQDLVDALPAVVGRRVRLLHHGSAPGSDRHALRSLRSCTAVAAAPDPEAREELRRLGFAHVVAAPGEAFDAALDDVTADAATAANVERHPGPRIVVAGPVEPSRSLELVIDAFAELLTHHRPSATLSICGPASHWYATQLRRRIVTSGLTACELLQPHDDSQLAARLDSASAVVALHPAGLAPYLRRAERSGARIVAPIDATALRLTSAQLVRLPARADRHALTNAMVAATAPPTSAELGEPSDSDRHRTDVGTARPRGEGDEAAATGGSALSSTMALMRALQLG